MLSRFHIILCALLMLSACVPTPEELHAIWTERCTGYGFKPKTSDMANCLMTQDTQYRARVAAIQPPIANTDIQTGVAGRMSPVVILPTYRPTYSPPRTYPGYGLKRY